MSAEQKPPSRTITIVTRPDGITQADLDANGENVKANVRRGAQQRASEAGMTLDDYVRSVLLPDLQQGHSHAELQWVYDVFGLEAP